MRQRARRAANWRQGGYDAAHTGFNPLEAELSPATVGALAEVLKVPVAPAISGSPTLATDDALHVSARERVFDDRFEWPETLAA